MSANDQDAAADKVTPEMLMSGLRSCSIGRGITYSVIIHVIIIGVTSIGFIVAGFTGSDEAAPPVAEGAAAEATTPEGQDGTGAKTPEDQPATAKTNGKTPAKAEPTTNGTGESKTTPTTKSGKREPSAIERVLDEKTPPDKILRTPPKINLNFEDDL